MKLLIIRAQLLLKAFVLKPHSIINCYTLLDNNNLKIDTLEKGKYVQRIQFHTRLLDSLLRSGGKRVSSSYVQKAPITALKRTSADFNSLECITDYNL